MSLMGGPNHYAEQLEQVRRGAREAWAIYRAQVQRFRDSTSGGRA
jgi:hypothetical protein